MRKHVKDIAAHLEDWEIEFLTEGVAPHMKSLFGVLAYPEVPVGEFEVSDLVKYLYSWDKGDQSEKYARSIRKFTFLTYEVGDSLILNVNERLNAVGIGKYKPGVCFDNGNLVEFRVREIHYDELRMDGVVFEIFDIINVFYSDVTLHKVNSHHDKATCAHMDQELAAAKEHMINDGTEKLNSCWYHTPNYGGQKVYAVEISEGRDVIQLGGGIHRDADVAIGIPF